MAPLARRTPPHSEYLSVVCSLYSVHTRVCTAIGGEESENTTALNLRHSYSVFVRGAIIPRASCSRAQPQQQSAKAGKQGFMCVSPSPTPPLHTHSTSPTSRVHSTLSKRASSRIASVVVVVCVFVCIFVRDAVYVRVYVSVGVCVCIE